MDAAIAASAKALGGLDAVILTAGVFDLRVIEDTSDADWRRVLSINLDGPFHVARAAAPHLRASKGALVLFSSQVGLVGHPRATSYAVSKSGVNGLVRTLAVEFAAWGGRVNAVAPGPVETGMTEIARLGWRRLFWPRGKVLGGPHLSMAWFGRAGFRRIMTDGRNADCRDGIGIRFWNAIAESKGTTAATPRFMAVTGRKN